MIKRMNKFRNNLKLKPNIQKTLSTQQKVKIEALLIQPLIISKIHLIFKFNFHKYSLHPARNLSLLMTNRQIMDQLFNRKSL
jgi:hypothetical protein